MKPLTHLIAVLCLLGCQTLNAADDAALVPPGINTSPGANFEALVAILDEWNLGAPLDDRIAHLTGMSTGLNAPFLLRHDALTVGGGTVHDDGQTDRLAGDSGADWFFAFEFDILTLATGDVVNHAPI